MQSGDEQLLRPSKPEFSWASDGWHEITGDTEINLAAHFVALRVAAQQPRMWYSHLLKDWSEGLPIGDGWLATMAFRGVDEKQF